MSGHQLAVGAHGSIKTKLIRPKVWKAQCRVRDADGRTRQVSRTAATKTAAENALQSALVDRQTPGAGAITGDTKLTDLADVWFGMRQDEVDEGEIAPGTMRVYRSGWRLHLEPALGGLRLRELTVARCQAWQTATRRSAGPSSTRTARAVLSGMLGHAATIGAIPVNPTRSLAKIPGQPQRKPRAMTREERTAFFAWMEDHAVHRAALDVARTAGGAELAAAKEQLRLAEKAVRWEIPDLARFMLSTGVRIGEALAVTWPDVDLDHGLVQVRHHLVRVEGEGLIRQPGTKRGDGRELRLPSWATEMLRERWVRLPAPSRWAVFPDRFGGWRDPSNTLRTLREVRDAAGMEWMTSHSWRKTCATVLDEAGWTPRQIADQLEHADPSMTMDVYMGRGAVATAEQIAALDDLL